MTHIDIAALDDEPGRVYVFGVGFDIEDEFYYQLAEALEADFEHAKIFVFNMEIDSELVIAEVDEAEVEAIVNE